MEWKQLLASITSPVDEEPRLRNAYLMAENRILRSQITGRVLLTDAERKTLAERGQQPAWSGRRAMPWEVRTTPAAPLERLLLPSIQVPYNLFSLTDEVVDDLGCGFTVM